MSVLSVTNTLIPSCLVLCVNAMEERNLYVDAVPASVCPALCAVCADCCDEGEERRRVDVWPLWQRAGVVPFVICGIVKGPLVLQTTACVGCVLRISETEHPESHI